MWLQGPDLSDFPWNLGAVLPSGALGRMNIDGLMLADPGVLVSEGQAKIGVLDLSRAARSLVRNTSKISASAWR
jgi:hypothetical protein